MRRLRIILLAVAVLVTSGSGWGVVGDSVTHDAREELVGRGAVVYSAPGVFIRLGRPAVRRLVRTGHERIVIELGLMDVSFRATAGELRHRLRAVMRDDLDGVACVVWTDLKTTSAVHPQWPARSGEFNQILRDLAEEYGVHVARWSVIAARHPDWFRPDGIHLVARGQLGYARYLEGRVDHFC